MNGAVRPKFDLPFTKCKEGIVPALPDEKAGFKAGPSLPNDDLTRQYPLPSEGFHPQPLGVGIATILSTALSFDVRHSLTLIFKLNFLYPKLGKDLPVADFLPIIFPAEVFKRNHLGLLCFPQVFAKNRGPLDEGIPHFHGLTLSDHENLIEDDLF